MYQCKKTKTKEFERSHCYIFGRMVWALTKGLMFGAVMSMMLGTVFFSIIQNSIQSGWNKGVVIAAGVVISDFIFIALAIVGVSFIDPEEGNIWIEIAAAVLLLFMGINLMMNRSPAVVYPETKFGKALFYFSNGFLLNILNPVNFLFWAGVAAMARSSWHYTTDKLIIFFAGCLIGIFCTEVLIAYGAHKIKKFINQGLLVWVNRITGIIFICIGVYFGWNAFF